MELAAVSIVPIRACEALPSGKVSLSVGRNVLRAEATGGSPDERYAFCILHLRLTATPSHSGRSGKAIVRWQDIPIATATVPSYGSVCTQIPLEGFKTPSTFVLDVSLSEEQWHFDGDFDVFKLSGAVTAEIFVEISQNPIGRRAYIVRSAESWSREMGLHGDYLTPSCSENIEKRILGAITRRHGFSLVRLGDGEGRVLGYPGHFTDQEVLAQVLHYQFGPESMQRVKAADPDNWIGASMSFLRGKLEQSVQNADMLGVPVSEFYCGMQKAITHGMLGYACAMLYAMSSTRPLKPTDYVGTNVFQLAAAKGAIFKNIVLQAKWIYLVGPWDLRPDLANVFGRADLNYIRVPGHYTWRGSTGFGQYPDLYRYVETRLLKLGDISGCLFLVGAGILGKYYCDLIKRQGGVALDIGSVFDSWAKRGLPYAVENTDIEISKLSRENQ